MDFFTQWQSWHDQSFYSVEFCLSLGESKAETQFIESLITIKRNDYVRTDAR